MSTTGATVHTTNAVSLADEEEVKQVLLNSVLDLWEVVNNLTRLRPSRRDRYRVTIFGSARPRQGGGFRLRGNQSRGGSLGGTRLRYRHWRRPWPDAGCQRRSRQHF